MDGRGSTAVKQPQPFDLFERERPFHKKSLPAQIRTIADEIGRAAPSELWEVTDGTVDALNEIAAEVQEALADR